MISHMELSARAALCRQLASREPDGKNVWLAEAERWSHFTRAPDIAAAIPHDHRVRNWCWHVVHGRQRLDDVTEMQFFLRFAEAAAGRDRLDALLTGLSAEASDPN
jgi:hypothetical protein